MVSTHFLANEWIIFFINGKPTVIGGPRNLPSNPSDCIILDSYAFENLILANDLFAKDLWRLATCVSVNKSPWDKLASSSPVIFEDNLRVTSVAFCVPDFNLFSFEADNFTFTVFYWAIPYQCLNKLAELIYNIFTVPCEKSRIVSLTSSMMKNIFVFPARCRFPDKYNCCMAFGSAVRALCLLRSIAISLQLSVKCV